MKEWDLGKRPGPLPENGGDDLINDIEFAEISGESGGLCLSLCE